MMKINKEKLFLFLLLVLSLLRFFYKLEERAMFEYDQEFLSLEAKKIIVDKKMTLIGAPTSVGGMFIAPLYSYLVALVMFLFKMSPYVVNYLTAFWGVLTILTIYFVSRDLLGFGSAVFASTAALFSFSFLDAIPPLVQPLALTSLLIFWFLLKVKKQRRYLFLASLLTGWAFNLHFSAIFFPVLILFYFLWSKRKIKSPQVLMVLLILLLFLSPLFLFEVRHNFFMTKNFLNFLKGSAGFKPALWQGFFWASKISFERLASLVFVGNLSVQLILVFIALLSSLKRLWLKNENLFKVFSLWLFVPILTFSFYKSHIIPYYFTLQEGVFFLSFGWFFSVLWKKKFLKPLIILFFLVFLKENFTRWLSWQTPRNLRNKILALEFIKEDSRNRSIYLSHTMEPGVDGGFTYLEWYLGINKKEDKTLPTYTLIAPFNWQGIKPDYTFGDYGVNLPKKQ